MARKAKESIPLDPKVTKWAVAELDKIEAELASERGSYMAHCKPIHERRRQLYEEAQARGAGKTALRAIFKSHRKALEAKRIIAELESDDRDQAAAMADQLGEDQLPLFVFAKLRLPPGMRAALRRAKKRPAPKPKLEVVPQAAE